MKLFSHLLLLFVHLNLGAQTFIEGVIENNNSEPVSGASIEYLSNGSGSVADIFGKFRIKKIVGDTIRISAIGFRHSLFAITEQTRFLKISLLEEYKLLSNVVVSNARKTRKAINIGFYSKDDNDFYGIGSSTEYAVFIPNSLNIRGYIDEIKFRLSDFKDSPYSLRMRLHGRDPITLLPSDSLFYSEDTILPEKLRKVTRLSLRSKNIKLPPGGIFVTYEWLGPVQEKFAVQIPTPYIIGNTDVDSNYVYTNYKNRGWNHSNTSASRSSGKPYGVPSISILVSY